jgi:hypothetical protein
MRLLAVLPGLFAFLSPSLSGSVNSAVAAAKENLSITLDCAGHAPDEKSPPHFASGSEVKFEVSATFGEGAIVALVDPETKAILKPLYDAESTSGHLKFSDGEETTVVWTRMSGADGALMGEAILSDGEVLALTVEQAAQGTANRSFVLFAAAPPSLVRGTCASAAFR